MQDRNIEWFEKQYNKNTPHQLLLDIDENDVPLLCQFLTNNPAITELNLGYVEEKEKHIKDAGACILAKWLESNKTVLNLALDNNGIRDRGATALAKALEVNRTLLYLKLSCANYIKKEGAQALAAMLHVNDTLLSLNLSHQDLQNDGISDIGNALKKNYSLKSLTLDIFKPDENITGLKILALGLEENTSLKSFDLAGNCSNNEGMIAICNMLIKNTTIRHLELSLCHISLIAGKLKEVFKANKTLISINIIDEDLFIDSNISPGFINSILERNNKLCKLAETSVVNNAIVVFQGTQQSNLLAHLPIELLFEILILTADNIREPKEVLDLLNLVHMNVVNKKWERQHKGKQIFQFWKSPLIESDENVIQKKLALNEYGTKGDVSEKGNERTCLIQ